MRHAALLLLTLILTTLALAAPSSRRVDIHLFGGDTTAGAPLASWYHSLGLTDLWLYPFAGAFPQDQRPQDQQSPAQGAALAQAYAAHGLRCWWMERPVPDVFYAQVSRDGRDLWDRSPETDRRWAEVCDKIRTIYPQVRAAGFRGVVYDCESYYSYQGDEAGHVKPWVWGGHASQYGPKGMYYLRGKQMGAAMKAAWPGIRVIMVYAFGYPGERWWIQGVQDAGVTVLLGPEHTYGAGPPGDLGEAWYQSWWQGRQLVATCNWKRTQFPFVKSNQQLVAGLFPIEFMANKPNYRAQYFREQLQQAAQGDPKGPIAVWLWPQGPFTPESWQQVKYAAPDTAESYLSAMREFSTGLK